MLLRPLTQMKCEDKISQHPLYNQSSPRTLSHMWVKVLNMCSHGFFYKKTVVPFYNLFPVFLFTHFCNKRYALIAISISFCRKQLLSTKNPIFFKELFTQKKILKFQLNVSWIILQLILFQNCVITLNNLLILSKIISQQKSVL